MKKLSKNIILVIGLILVIVFSIVLKVASLREKEITEYDFQELYLDKADITDFKEASKLFHTDKVMTYDEYVEFCVQWNLNQVYDKDGKYAIHARMYEGVRGVDIHKVIQKRNHVDAIGVCHGAANAEFITIDFLVIPVKNKVETITYMELLN